MLDTLRFSGSPGTPWGTLAMNEEDSLNSPMPYLLTAATLIVYSFPSISLIFVFVSLS